VLNHGRYEPHKRWTRGKMPIPDNGEASTD
jgi:hypothetical protein